jgi:hypothetical protein
MAKLFVGGGLPKVVDVRDVYEHGRELRRRKVPITRGEEELLRQVTWSMLQLQNDQEESELHQALARLAALVLAIIEDDDLSIPEGYTIGSRDALEGLAVQVMRDFDQLDMQIAVVMGLHGVDIQRADDVGELERRLPMTPELERALKAMRIHLSQGEGLLAKQRDAARAARQRERLRDAYERGTRLLGRLLAVPEARDPKVVRANIVRRELRRLEVDALGVERLTEAEQVRHTRQLLAWTEEDLGASSDELTDEGKAQLADRLREVAEKDTKSSGGWFFKMD